MLHWQTIKAEASDHPTYGQGCVAAKRLPGSRSPVVLGAERRAHTPFWQHPVGIEGVLA